MMDRTESWISRHLLAFLNMGAGAMVLLPIAAPLSMQLGLSTLGAGGYWVYQWLCHQYADRSFFIFGPRLTYGYAELAPYLGGGDIWGELASFVSNGQLGYKLAWSDRMVAMSLGLLIGGLLYALLRSRLRPLSATFLLLSSLPMTLDGGTHLISDLFGHGRGFRYTNAWLAELTGHSLGNAFYVGNTLGSFNSSMRLITGLFFCLGLVWFAYPRIDTGLVSED